MLKRCELCDYETGSDVCMGCPLQKQEQPTDSVSDGDVENTICLDCCYWESEYQLCLASGCPFNE